MLCKLLHCSGSHKLNISLMAQWELWDRKMSCVLLGLEPRMTVLAIDSSNLLDTRLQERNICHGRQRCLLSSSRLSIRNWT
jgi:hypothetical protein